MSEKTGRPSKMTPEVIEKAKKYLIDFNGASIPTVAGICKYLGIGKSTLYDWARDNQFFSETLEQLQLSQEIMLIEGGLNNRYSSNIAKLMLANHGYSDKQQLEHSTIDKEGKPVGLGIKFE